MISADIDLAVLDEVARYPAGTQELVDKRLSSSYLNWIRAASTPQFPSDQAGQLWDMSTRCRYEVKCSHCGTWQALEVDTHLNPETAQVECGHCKGDMTRDRLSVGHWEAENLAAPWEGYQVSKLMSHRVDLATLAALYQSVLRGDVSAEAVQQFWNQDVGRSYLPKGGHLDADLLDACCSDSDYTHMPSTGDKCVMGVDVGSSLHVVIVEPRGSLLYIVFAATVATFEELGALFVRYGVRRCVIDAAPETHKAREFADEPGHRGRVWLATYVEDQTGNKSQICKWDEKEHTVQVNRTMAMDTVLHCVNTRRYVLPYPPLLARELGGAVNTTGTGAFYRQLCSPIRVLVLDAKDRQVARYDQNGPDHYAHATLYSMAALDQAIGELGVPPPIEHESDPDDPYAEMSPIDALFRQDPTAHAMLDSGSTRVVPMARAALRPAVASEYHQCPRSLPRCSR